MSSHLPTGHWPTELRLGSNGKALKLVLDTHEEFEISAELLRVESPSAEVKGHGPGQEKLIYGKADVSITNLEPVGTYAIRLIFSDGHSTGIFTPRPTKRRRSISADSESPGPKSCFRRARRRA